MKLEVHLLQNFAPSNLNRDDTGAPKDCEFGGYRRARISSQCIKRAIRRAFQEQGLLPPEHLATRTRLLVDELARRLVAQGKPEEAARSVVAAALGGAGFRVRAEDGTTEYLLFLGKAEVDALTEVCARHWDVLLAATNAGDAPAGARRTTAREAKRARREAVPDEVRLALDTVLDGRRAADLALFGRMLADRPEKNIDAAAQVAHALSTNRVSMEFDFYTAVDDLQPKADTGAGMMGTVEFNSACFYRYANVDLDQLLRNLGGDAGLAQATVRAFLRALIEAVPTGKQNSMAAQNPPSFVFAVLRDRGLWSLANAFLQPVRPNHEGDLMQNSIAALARYWDGLVRLYGDDDIRGTWCATYDGDALQGLASARVPSVPELIDRVIAAIRFETAT